MHLLKERGVDAGSFLMDRAYRAGAQQLRVTAARRRSGCAIWVVSGTVRQVDRVIPTESLIRSHALDFVQREMIKKP